MERDLLYSHLNDLIKLNADRIRCYEQAVKELRFSKQGRSIFIKRALEGRILRWELWEAMEQLGGIPFEHPSCGNAEPVNNCDSPADETSGQSVFELCKHCDGAALTAYDSLISAHLALPEKISKTIMRHRKTVREAHQMMTGYLNELKSHFSKSQA